VHDAQRHIEACALREASHGATGTALRRACGSSRQDEGRLQRQALLFQLNQTNKVSDTTRLADTDLNHEDE
jgi:hypothetical protein